MKKLFSYLPVDFSHRKPHKDFKITYITSISLINEISLFQHVSQFISIIYFQCTILSWHYGNTILITGLNNIQINQHLARCVIFCSVLLCSSLPYKELNKLMCAK